MKTHTVYLALGSNLGDRKRYITQAIACIKTKVIKVLVAPIYESLPIGYKAQNNFFNTILKGETLLENTELLVFLKKIEKSLGRQKRWKNGPREIDIDILLFDHAIISSSDLIIPHPRMHDRDFVLRPFVDLAPKEVHPLLHKTVQELFTRISPDEYSIVGIAKAE